MYSYEDWFRAVRLYIRLGKRLGLTIHQLGYPATNALKHGIVELSPSPHAQVREIHPRDRSRSAARQR